MTRDNLVVWSYDSATANGNADYEIEVHGVQRLENGLTMIAESGRARIIEVDQAGEIRHEVALKVNHPPHPHQDTRQARKLPSGNYLVAHERDQAVREYSPDGDVIWEYTVEVEPNPPPRPAGQPLYHGPEAHGPEGRGVAPYCAVRLTNGNTLIGTGRCVALAQRL